MGLIYMFTSPSGKKYIGQTNKSFETRKAGHLSKALKNDFKYSCPAFHNAIRKYGIENFKEEILFDGINDQDKLDEHEYKSIIEHNTISPNGYNLRDGGRNGNALCQESKTKISDTLKRLYKTVEFSNAVSHRNIQMKNDKSLPMYIREEKNKRGVHVGYYIRNHPNNPHIKKFGNKQNLPEALERAKTYLKYLNEMNKVVDVAPEKPGRKRKQHTSTLPKYVSEVNHRKTYDVIGYRVNAHQFGGSATSFTSKSMSMEQKLSLALEYLKSQLEGKAQRLEGSG